MKQIITLLFLLVTFIPVFAQTTNKGEARTATQNVFVKIDGAQNSWIKGDNEGSKGVSTPALGNENVSYSSTSEGIYVSILKGTNKIRLFALTGQMLLNGDLTQGRFFIPTHRGIYFLKVNNKSYKVICK